jgi:hypothetical protein
MQNDKIAGTRDNFSIYRIYFYFRGNNDILYLSRTSEQRCNQSSRDTDNRRRSPMRSFLALRVRRQIDHVSKCEVELEADFTNHQWRPAMASILIHCSHPARAASPITGFAFTIEYDEGKRVRFTDLAIPPSSDANSIGAFRQELRRLGTAILNVASSGDDIRWDRTISQRLENRDGPYAA